MTITITAPYNFAPLPEKVVLAPQDWVQSTSHDIPLDDGLCGSIDYTLTAHSPLLVGGLRSHDGQTGEVRFFKTPDHRHAIPGSSLRGMIRAVLEIATFGKFRQVDDRRFGYRDLSNSSLGVYYKHAMIKQPTHAGWLSFNAGCWQLKPCEFARIHHDQLGTLKGWSPPSPLPCSCAALYAQWRGSLRLKFKGIDSKNTVVDVSLNTDAPGTTGTLVMTGMPNRNKKREFVFYDETPAPPLADEHVTRAVNDLQQMVNALDPAQIKASSWTYWKRRIEQGESAPVFFKRDEQERVDSIGMAFMYKLPYAHTVHELIDAQHRDAAPDLAELIFGHIDEHEHGQHSLRGRVNFDLAIEETPACMAPPLTTVLNGPKASYYPNYIDQGGKTTDVIYKTYDDDKARLRGWKRYPAREQITNGTQGTDAVSTTLHPLASGTAFKGRVVFHNLRPEELGALLWTLSWGGRPDLRHSLGMGKPLGYGQVAFTLDRLDLRPNNPARAIDKDAAIERFKRFMDTQIAETGVTWEKHATLQSLIAMADPAQSQGRTLEHMRLAMRGPNDFSNAKNQRLALPNYIVPKIELSSASTHWHEAKLEYNPGKGELVATHAQGVARSAPGQGKALFEQLSKNQQGKAKSGGVHHAIEVEGIPGANHFILKSLIKNAP